MKYPLITEIQKFSIHDGPGIRTTVFFKGCPLHCSWCHNPETQSYEQQFYHNKERCSGCGECVRNCSSNAIYMSDKIVITDLRKCTECGACMEQCVFGARELVGSAIEPSKLISELQKDSVFYEESGGGITFSGGEVMTINFDYLLQVMKPLHRLGYSLAIDTCGYVNYEKFQEVVPFTDFFLYDFKMMDSLKHYQFTGVYNDLILNNLKRLSEDGARIYLRIPVICGVNSSMEEMGEILEYLVKNKINIIQIHLLPYHTMGKHKYDRLNKASDGHSFISPTDVEMEKFKKLFCEKGFLTVIGG